ncbi:hypothetical protein [Bradyrhizobium sp. HKCCYLR20261]|uniref:phosphorylase family protein n=1 Tax=Bradyrhizobium sp. HKCCYLR20261 TaxID=3420760 RepID=UPI003EB752E7
MSSRDGPAQISSILTPGSIRPRPIFLHFFDVHFLEERGSYAKSRNALEEMDLATRFAVMVGSRILIPASSYHESAIAATVLKPFLESAFVSQRFVLVGGGSSIEEFRYEKLPQYAPGSPQHSAYLASMDQPMGWHRRTRSAGRDIALGWLDALQSGEAGRSFHGLYTDGRSEDVFEKQWAEVEERLAGAAWVVDHILPVLGLDPTNLIIRNRSHSIVNREYFRSYSKDPGAGMIQGLLHLGSHDLPSEAFGDDIRYDILVKACRDVELLDEIRAAAPDDLDALSRDPRFIDAFEMTQTQGYATLPVVTKTRVDLAIVTALPIEREAVQHVFGEGRLLMVNGDANMYRLVQFDIASRKVTVVYGTSDQGNTRAAVLAANMLRSFDVRWCAFVGIAGGCPNPSDPETHVRLGDVVISTKVAEHDHTKRHADGRLDYRDEPQRASHAWLQAASMLKNNTSGFSDAWRTAYVEAMVNLGATEPDPTLDVLHDADGGEIAHPIDPRRTVPGRSMVHTGVIAAGDTLLKDPAVRDAIRDRFKAMAIEMEAAGLREAAYAQSTDFIVVRGIVDYCDAHKADNYRAKASASAAAVLRLLFDTLVSAETT